jgi:hypothetical protein
MERAATVLHLVIRILNLTYKLLTEKEKKQLGRPRSKQDNTKIDLTETM